MSRPAVEWLAGGADDEARRAVAQTLLAASPRTSILAASPRRSVHRVAPSAHPSPRSGALVAKVHHTATGRHPWRERWKRALGRSPARREWMALETLFAVGVPVPRPIAYGRLASGDEVVVMSALDGRPIDEPITDPSDPIHRAVIDGLADAIARLHDAGYCHGDLHRGNCWQTASGIALLDLQRAAPLRGARDRLHDLAGLELSLARAGWSARARAALRDRLGVGAAFDRALRRFLRDHLRGRARRVLRPGRRWDHARIAAAHGLRVTALEPATLAALIGRAEEEPRAGAAHGAPSDGRTAGVGGTRRNGRVRLYEAKAEGRCYVVKHARAGQLRRALRDAWRGTAAARAFRTGQAHALLVDRAARPVAFLERRRLGLPVETWLVLEKVGDVDLDAWRTHDDATRRSVAVALGEWLAEGHAWGLAHRDAKAGNLRLSLGPEGIRFWWVDLEDLAGPVEIPEAARRLGLAQLNASLADDAFDVDARRRALDAYLRRLPFDADATAVARDVARRSLARAHRWTGRGCARLDP